MRVETELDTLLCLLYSPGHSGKIAETVEGITRLQKLLFLLWKEGGFSQVLDNPYGFQAYDFGPCMDDLYDDLDFAKETELIHENVVDATNAFEDIDESQWVEELGFKPQTNYVRRDYSLTRQGLKAGEALWKSLTPDQQAEVQRVKRTFNGIPLLDLLRYVYRKYPKFAKKSLLHILR
jgi:uncharacterized protein